MTRITSNANLSCLVAALALALLAVAGPAAADKPDWQKHIDWCIGDTGPPNCPEQYQYPECLAHGNRSCLMQKGIQSAKDGDCANAFRQALTCQCHNGGAQQALGAAGQQAVCSYMKAK